MSDVIRKTTNKWTKGLVMDFSPENTRNEILTHALNATLLTFNGNELSLQNDMGNARVETAFLPEGYIPVGTCEYGGIIYIVSYNPLEDKSQIGCFPSPERNISNKELGKSDAVISKTDFQEYVNGELTGNLISPTKYVLLKEDNLNPGDKFLICANDTIYQEKLSDLQIWNDGMLNPIEHPIIALNVVSIEDSGKIIYLNSDLCKYDINKEEQTYNYHIVGEMSSGSEISQEKLDPDSYRNVLKSGYNVFKSKTSGKLAILAELLTIDSYAVTHSLQPSVDKSGNVLEGQFDIIIHSEIEPKITESNYALSPKLKYYYLKNSQGYIQTDVNQANQVELFKENKENPEFFNIKLSDVYIPIFQDDASITDELEATLNPDDFDFKLPNTYHARMEGGKEADFIPKQGDSISYPDVKLAHIKIPEFVSKNGLDLPFKYDYTLVPCMNYGKLNHLAVSNTVDFSKLHAFNQSNFTTWKYHIDENQLRLNFGADIFDTYETDKVDALILEFYDCWGFAGSIILSDKRSYSGVFTKIIPLNTFNALSPYKINSTLPFKRNINIVQDVDGFKFNGKPVEFTEDGGWKYVNGTYLEDNNNDCGTLYPNLIYGVKAYLRRTINKGNLETEHYEYIKKKDMFLYTLPIYNDYYYTTDDFNTLIDPQLRFVLTYQLEDSSVKEIYNENTINKGYSISDLSVIEKYLNGRLEDNIHEVDVIKYYKYKGSSKLKLEIGLQKEYQDLYLSYSADLNKYFNCKLRLISNESENSTFSVVSKATTPELALQYINQDGQLDLKLNSITFDASANPSINQEINIKGEKFKNLNFINTADVENPTYIPINYEFIVGYKASITDIRATEVSATTACALFHNNKGNYNYEDFGVYEKIDQDESGVIEYLSAAAFYNEGSKETEIFGICKQLKAAIDGNINSHWQSYDSIEKEATKITTPLKFNTGSSLKYLIPHIGKYTFCQPYVPPLSDEYATNLLSQDLGNVSQLIIDPDFTIHDSYKEYPRYSLVLNTQSSIQLNSEFIATIPYSIENIGTSRLYSMFTGKDIEVFNRAMLKTMSKVYAYNPDYDSLEVNVGNVTVIDNGIQFISNLLSSESEFVLPNETSLNDYIYLGTMQVSKYLRNLEDHSTNKEDFIKSFDDAGKPVPQIAFTPNYLYCGTPESSYLVSTLTYNMPKPAELEAELAFDSVPGVVARHYDGSVDLISGEINKNSLYGYNENNNLVQLDVSNYTIDSNGDLTIGKEAYGGEQKEVIEINQDRLQGNGWDVTFVGEKEVLSTIPVTLKFSFERTKIFEDWIVVGIESLGATPGADNYIASIKPRLLCDSAEYFTELIEMEVEECKGSVLISDYWGISGKYLIDEQKPETLFELATKKEGNVAVTPKKLGGEQESFTPALNVVSVQQLAAPIAPFHTLKNETIELYTNSSNSNWCGAVYALKLRSLTFRISKKKNIEGIKDSVISCMKTKHYSDLLDNVYRILPMYDSARLRGTSLTLNDLYYDSSDFNHRLFVREGLVSNITNKSNKLYFREVDKDLDKDSVNYILLQTGPCFTKDNL